MSEKGAAVGIGSYAHWMISPGMPYDEMMRLTAEQLADAYERQGLMDPEHAREYGRSVHYMIHSGKDFD